MMLNFNLGIDFFQKIEIKYMRSKLIKYNLYHCTKLLVLSANIYINKYHLISWLLRQALKYEIKCFLTPQAQSFFPFHTLLFVWPSSLK